MSKRMIIVSGGKIEDDFARSVIESEEKDCIIAVDRGMDFCYRQKLVPDYIVGDFDSADEEVADYFRNEAHVPIREYSPVKDSTDTEIAIRLAMTLGCKELVILGATGGRIDHLWANIQCLNIPFKAGVDVCILDSQNQIRLIGEETHLYKRNAYGPYFSLFPLGGDVYGVTVTGAKYPLHGHTLTSRDSLCVSNEFAEEEVVITFGSGTVILMETRDKE